jgi:cell division protein ZapA (FtsZ GTPase activity inhibitor)
MATSANTELNVFGQKIVLKHKLGDPKLVQQVIALVTSKIEEAQSRTKAAPPHQVTLLALMDLAAEYIQAKERTEEFRQQVDAKSIEIQRWIDTELVSSPEK